MSAHTHESNTKRIWTVFGILSVLTIVEVALGIFKPDFLFHTKAGFWILHLSLLNWIFIILTIVKAYYIMWAFMHLEGEKKGFVWTIAGTMVFLIVYMVLLVLDEGQYVYDVYNSPVAGYRWIF